jgi:hypothetical protein
MSQAVVFATFGVSSGCLPSTTTTVTNTKVVVSDTGAEVAPPASYVTPGSIAIEGACEVPDLGVSLGNIGDGPLTLVAVSVEGAYLLPELALPLVIASGDELFIALDGEGEGAVEFVTDDPLRPLLRVPLQVTLDTPPEVQLLTPVAGEVLERGVVTELEALVIDRDDGPASLDVEWLSSTEGVIGTSIVGLDGRTLTTWEPDFQGYQDVSVAVTDTCGNRVEVTQELCRQGEVRSFPLRSSDWHMSGTSYFDPITEQMHLTDDEGWSIGSGFWMAEAVDAANFTLDLEFYVSSVSAPTADGMALVLLDAERFTSFLGPGGGGMGFGEGVEPGTGLPGAAVEIDISYNETDSTRNNHVALSFDGRMESPAYAVEIGDVDNGSWHALRVEHASPVARAYIDGVLVADVEVMMGLDFTAYIGFTAATGTYTANHWLRDVVLTAPVCRD